MSSLHHRCSLLLLLALQRLACELVQWPGCNLALPAAVARSLAPAVNSSTAQTAQQGRQCTMQAETISLYVSSAAAATVVSILICSMSPQQVLC
jgi:hypothetical protein